MNEVLNCDNPDCGHVEHVGTITADMIDMPCPKCGENLLTAEDFEGWEVVKMLMDAAQSVVGDVDDGDPVEMRVKLHEGTLDITFKDLPEMSNPGDRDYEC